MESVAAERLTKIGKNPSIVSSRADLEEDQKMVNEIVMESTPIPTSESEKEDGDSDESWDGAKSKKKHQYHLKKFDFPTKLHKISEERKKNSKDQKDLLEFDSKQHHGHSWAKLPKVYSGSNLFGLKVPILETRKRSGSVGDAYGLAGTRLTQSLDEGDEQVEEETEDDKRRNSLLGGKKVKGIELKVLNKFQKDDKKRLQSPTKDKKKLFADESSTDAQTSLLQPCDPKDSSDFTSIQIPDTCREVDSAQQAQQADTPTTCVGVEGRLKTLKSSLKSCTAPILAGSEPAEISDVECSQLGSSPQRDAAAPSRAPEGKDEKNKDTKVMFITDPIIKTYRNASNS